MARRRRRIESMKVYEICFRARDTLPLVARKLIDMIIEHAVARAQRDEKLYLCHDIWNGSHPHLIVLTKDAEQCKKFYMEVQKKITDCLKRLLGLSYLSIWEGRPTVALIDDLDEAVRRISYLYANPAQDNLEISIERFPGLSSFSEFLSVKDKGIEASTSKDVPRLRLPSLPTISSNPTFEGERGAIKLLRKQNRELQPLVRHPNIWMKAYGVRDKDISRVNERVIERLRRREAAAERLRKATQKSVMGRAKLTRQEILKPHTPKKKERKVFYYGSCKKTRIRFLEEFQEFCRRCRECYQRWRQGDFAVVWPPGAFKPAMPPNMNIVTL